LGFRFAALISKRRLSLTQLVFGPSRSAIDPQFVYHHREKAVTKLVEQPHTWHKIPQKAKLRNKIPQKA